MLPRFVALAVLLPLLVIVASCFGGGPASTTKRFYSSVEQGEIEAALEMFSQSFLDRFPQQKLKAAIQDTTRKIDQKGGIEKFEVLEEETIGEISEVRVRIVYGNEEVDEETVNLVKEDGKWKLQPKK